MYTGQPKEAIVTTLLHQAPAVSSSASSAAPAKATQVVTPANSSCATEPPEKLRDEHTTGTIRTPVPSVSDQPAIHQRDSCSLLPDRLPSSVVPAAGVSFEAMFQRTSEPVSTLPSPGNTASALTFGQVNNQHRHCSKAERIPRSDHQMTPPSSAGASSTHYMKTSDSRFKLASKPADPSYLDSRPSIPELEAQDLSNTTVVPIPSPPTTAKLHMLRKVVRHASFSIAANRTPNILKSSAPQTHSFTAGYNTRVHMGPDAMPQAEAVARSLSPTGSQASRRADRKYRKSRSQLDKSALWDYKRSDTLEATLDLHADNCSNPSGTLEAWKQDLKMVGRVVRRDPWVLAFPLIKLCVLLSFGLWVVLAVAAGAAHDRRSLAIRAGSDKSQVIDSEFGEAVQPAIMIGFLVRQNPTLASMLPYIMPNVTFASLAEQLLAATDAECVQSFALAPHGVIQAVYPSTYPFTTAIGLDWLTMGLEEVGRALQTRKLTIVGPFALSGSPEDPQSSMGVLLPIFLPKDSINGTSGTTSSATASNELLNTNNTHFWGFANLLIDWNSLRDTVANLPDLQHEGYDYVLTRPDVNGTELAVAWSDSMQPKGDSPQTRLLVYHDLHKSLRNAISINVNLPNINWTLHLTIAGGNWYPSWTAPVVAGVVLISFTMSLFLFVILVGKRQHLWLLQAMVPKKVIPVLKLGRIFAEDLANVTVLFSDIVSYTNMAAGMPPLQVVEMLNEVYSHYDELVDKYGLYKVEIIGDAFMVVGGAPEADDAVSAAARVSLLALEMVNLTQDLVTKRGHRIQIRVGIHSGPAVAAVVGRKMPRYSLFGDTVNTASRMESTGQPMRIHISSGTASLLQQEGGFTVERRGEIEVKSKGTMVTHWLIGACQSDVPGHIARPSICLSSGLQLIQTMDLVDSVLLSSMQDVLHGDDAAETWGAAAAVRSAPDLSRMLMSSHQSCSDLDDDSMRP